MKQIGGKNAKKTSKKSSDSKRHFTVVMENKEHGLYVSSSPSSAAKKAVTKLCTANKSKKVEFYIREITQGSKKKTYGSYIGYIEKLKEPIELKGRIIKYKPVAKLSGKSGKKMKGGEEKDYTFNNLNNVSSNSINGLTKTANNARIKANASRKQAIENQQKANEQKEKAEMAKIKANASEKVFSNLKIKYPEINLNKIAENAAQVALNSAKTENSDEQAVSNSAKTENSDKQAAANANLKAKKSVENAKIAANAVLNAEEKAKEPNIRSTPISTQILSNNNKKKQLEQIMKFNSKNL